MEDLTPENVELWIDNYKRPDVINDTIRSWLDSFDFKIVNIITNHSSITLDTIDKDIKPLVKIWNNELRHDSSKGPINKNINNAYVHTFLSGKEYCVVAHDNMIIKKGWADIVRNNKYDFYAAPQGDQVHIQTLDGLRKIGWWDERYATMGYHELDYFVRAIREDLLRDDVNVSIIDWHCGWPDGVKWTRRTPGGCPCYFNPIGLEDCFTRMDKAKAPQADTWKTSKLHELAHEWHNKKWRNEPPCTANNIELGPTEPEVNWHPWLDLDTLDANVTYKY